MSIALEIQGVSKVYHGGGLTVTAVKHVSFSVPQGQFVALVGPSGSGKTTLLAILAALLRSTEGQVVIDGQDLTHMSEGARAKFRRQKIGFTFQSNNLVPYLTALENVELMLRLNGLHDKATSARAKDLLTQLGLGERLNNLPRQLSGGQQQRVAIARALVHRPAIVLADEPTASLDTERAHQAVETFGRLVHEQQRAGIMVTHDLRMVQYADRVIQMTDGLIVRDSTNRAEIDGLANGGRHEHPAPAVIASVTQAPASGFGGIPALATG
ncbi:MAG: ABC transporter ATP-binding protein [Chloroflexi bacterium]|nr:ABC transporter ATP-binding protein [Chloroflexota bacterium]